MSTNVEKESHSNTTTHLPIMDDLYYASRYEDLLLQQRLLHQGMQTANYDDNKGIPMNHVTSLILNHAEMITMLENAVKAAKTRAYWATNSINNNNNGTNNNENKNEQQHLEALETLLHETWNRHMYETDEEESLQNPSLYISSSSLITMSALQQCNDDEYKAFWNRTGNLNKTSFENDKHMLTTDPKTMSDAFFNDYPECVHADFDKKNNDIDNDDDDDEFWADINMNPTEIKQKTEISHVNRPPPYPQQNQQEQHIMGSDSNNIRAPSKSIINSKPPLDTYIHTHPPTVSDISRHRSVPFDVDALSFTNNKDDFVPTITTNLSNPYRVFKTAKEFAMDNNNDHKNNNKMSGPHNGGGYYPTQSHPRQQQRQQQQQQQYCDYSTSTDMDPWGSFKPSSNSNSRDIGEGGGYINTLNHPSFDDNSTYQRPGLSVGLKRKFQLPKPRSTQNPGTSVVGNSSTQHEKSYGSGSSSTTTTTAAAIKPPTHKPNSPDDDDTLPEELKGLDKELISKIEMEIVDSGDPVSFQDIAGLTEAKQTIMELICWPMKRPDLFTGLRRGPNGLLLFGPPGTGKTLIGKAIAYESGATFFSISSSSLTSKWIGEGEKLVRTLFAVAGYREPSVVFIDEIDSLLTQRKADENEASRRIKTEFLVQLDGTGTSGRGRVLVVGATNRPQELDDAARRRFVKRLYIPLPEADDRALLLKTLLSKNHHSLTDAEIHNLALDAKGFSGADLKALCTDSALGPIRQLGARALEIEAKDIPPISYTHFCQSLRGMNPSVAPSDIHAYLDWNQIYGSKKSI